MDNIIDMILSSLQNPSMHMQTCEQTVRLPQLLSDLACGFLHEHFICHG